MGYKGFMLYCFSVPFRMVRQAAEGLLPFHQPSLFFPVDKVKNSEAIIVNDLCVHISEMRNVNHLDHNLIK